MVAAHPADIARPTQLAWVGPGGTWRGNPTRYRAASAGGLSEKRVSLRSAESSRPLLLPRFLRESKVCSSSGSIAEDEVRPSSHPNSRLAARAASYWVTSHPE